jgi:hypothetical protein
MRGYKELTCIKFADSDFTWGSTTSEYIMLDSGVTIPTNVSTTDTVSSSVSHGTGTKSYAFLLPDVFDVVSAIDGTAYGTFRLYTNVSNTGTSGAYAEISSVDITLEAIDSDDNTRELFSDTVWTGSCKAELGETVYLGIMYWFDMKKQEIACNERLALTIEFDYTSNDLLENSSRKVGITCSADDKDMTLTLPFIV